MGESPHVVVVGAGPAGAALAYLLARRGIRVTLIERQTDFAREFRGEILMPSGIDALRQMGLGPAFDALPQARPQAIDFHVHGRFVQRFALPDFMEDTPRMVSQPRMLEMLVAQGEDCESFRFVRGGSVADLIEEAGRSVGVRLRGDAPEEIRADLVVGCDGRGSVVRRRAGLDEPRDPELFDVIWFKVPLPPQIEPGGAVQAFLRPGQLCLAFPTFDERLQVAWLIRKGSYGDLRQRGTDAWLADIAVQTGPEIGAHLIRHRDALESPFVLDVVCYLLERWTAPGVLLIGDACHPMSPVGGQGLNIALRDALVAANHLVPVLEGGAAPEALDAACAAVQKERYPEVAEVERYQRMPPRVVFRTDWWVGAVLWLVAGLARVGFLRGRVRLPAITRTFLHGTTDVRLQV
jgi:2-polyprenyl-6-methoxyphenol hydroxylase-like FAD-dependent oxidoreductase